MLRAGKHDGVIAWGGGSGLDTAKAIAFMAGQTRPMWDFEDIGDWWTRANPAGILPTIAVPTTAGTGSETGRASVITDEATHTKKVIFHPKMMPAIVIADPELTVGLPPKLTAGTGMDAFIHCFEAYCAPGYHPYAEGIAVEGMRLVKENLARAVKDGRDLEARGHMLAASQMGSTAFQKGLGAIHSLSHPVGAVLDTHHGLTNAVAMPYVVKFNRAAIEDKIVRLARWLDLRTPTFDGFMQWTLDLRREIGIPHTLAELGVKIEHLDKFSEMAAVDPTAGGNPVKAGVPEMRKMYERRAHVARDGSWRWHATFPCRSASQRRHHRRRHHGLLDGLSSGQERLEGRRAAGAGAAERRHDLACGRAGRPAARLPEPDAADPVQHQALCRARGRDRPGDGLEAVRLDLGRAHAGAHDLSAPLGGDGQQAGRRLRGADARSRPARSTRSCAPTTWSARSGCRATARPIRPTSPRRWPRARATTACASSRRRG